MGARWGWALAAAVAAGAAAVAVVAVVDDGPRPADAQVTTTTTAPGGGRFGVERAAAHRDGHGRGHGVGHARHGRGAARRADAGGLGQGRARPGQPEGVAAARRPQVQRRQAGGHHDDQRLRVPAVRQQRPDDHGLPGRQLGQRDHPRRQQGRGRSSTRRPAWSATRSPCRASRSTSTTPASLRKAARDDAVAHAKSQADQLAAATGMKVGKVVSIVEGSVPNIPLVYADSGRSGHHGRRIGAGPAAARASRS